MSKQDIGRRALIAAALSVPTATVFLELSAAWRLRKQEFERWQFKQAPSLDVITTNGFQAESSKIPWLEDARRSVGHIRFLGRNPAHDGSCTYIGKDIFVLCRHEFHDAFDLNHPILVEFSLPNVGMLQTRVAAVQFFSTRGSAKLDIAFLTIDRQFISVSGLKPVVWGPSGLNGRQQLEPLVSLGFRNGILHCERGYSRPATTSMQADDNNSYVCEVSGSGEIFAGMSGGPVFNLEGKFKGINTGKVDERNHGLLFLPAFEIAKVLSLMPNGFSIPVFPDPTKISPGCILKPIL